MESTVEARTLKVLGEPPRLMPLSREQLRSIVQWTPAHPVHPNLGTMCRSPELYSVHDERDLAAKGS